MEHADDPVDVLVKAKNRLHKNGQLFVSVPNALSLHRLVGAKRGIIKSPYDLGERDLAAGHKRVYDEDALAMTIGKAGLKIVKRLPIIAKPFPDAEMEDLNEEHLEMLQDLAVHRSSLDSQISYICQKVNGESPMSWPRRVFERELD